MKDIWVWLVVGAAVLAAVVFFSISRNAPTSEQVPGHEQHHAETVTGEIVQVEGGSYRNINSEQLWAMLQKKDFALINVHIPYEGELPETDAFVPYNEVEKNLNKLPQDKAAKIVLYCMSGRMSAIASETLVKLGYTNIWNLKEGMREWQEQGFPLLNKPQG